MQTVVLLSLTLAMLVSSGCGKKDNSPTGSVEPLPAIVNFGAYSAGSTSVGLSWEAPADSIVADIQQYEVNVKSNSANRILYIPSGQSSAVVGNLLVGSIYEFDIVALSGSSQYSNSAVSTVSWAPAYRFGGVNMYEIASTNGSLSGLQFFNVTGASPVDEVLPVDPLGKEQAVIDVLLDTNAVGDVILESATLNPYLPGGAPARHTRFSSVQSDADNLDFGSVLPPPYASYSQDTVVITSAPVLSGKIFYAISDDTTYVRMCVHRNFTSLFSGAPPNRYITVDLSYQVVRDVAFAKRRGH
jgi:hypothetical protein